MVCNGYRRSKYAKWFARYWGGKYTQTLCANGYVPGNFGIIHREVSGYFTRLKMWRTY
jgi:hypothetical protein